MQLYEQSWKAILTANKSNLYSVNVKKPKIKVKGVSIVKHNISFKNHNGKIMHGFIFAKSKQISQEVIIYLHGNGGCKQECLHLIDSFTKYNFVFAAFDMPGYGQNDQQYCTYGFNEVRYIRDMIDCVKNYIHITKVTLWGRTMGAVCLILFAKYYSSEINNLILDSPFESLDDVIHRIANLRSSAPKFIVNIFLNFVKQKAVRQSNYDLFTINYLEQFKKISNKIPILFIYSNFDPIVPSQQVFRFYNQYKGTKDLCEILEGHQQQRYQKTYTQCVTWLMNQKKRNIKGMIQARQSVKKTEQNIIKQWCC